MKENEFIRNCPICGKEIVYLRRRYYDDAIKNDSYCQQCVGAKRGRRQKIFFRNCPVCGKQLGYTIKKQMQRAERLGTLCGSCGTLEGRKKPGAIENYRKQAEEYKVRFAGEKNPFYGKHHTEESKNKIREHTDYSFTQTQEFKDKSARHGSDNGMYGKTFYDVWLEKYGKEEADRRLNDLKKKRSILSSGKNNPMYGKPAPKKSGSGWTGKYKGWYFRSLKELSYMIQVIEKNNYQWRSAETGDLRIQYKDHDGTDGTYVADFLIEEKTLVEVKPKKLMGTINNRLKKEAASRFCKDRGYKYIMVDVKILPVEKIIALYKSGEVKFSKKYQDKMEAIICSLEKRKK